MDCKTIFKLPGMPHIHFIARPLSVAFVRQQTLKQSSERNWDSPIGKLLLRLAMRSGNWFRQALPARDFPSRRAPTAGPLQ